MAAETLQLDLMDLADLGQPTKLALAVHRQLRGQFGDVPLPVPLRAIAEAVGIVGVKIFETTQFEGTLVISNGAGAIGLRRGLSAGRQAFTLAHEIGHFLIPSHRLIRRRFECSTADINKRRRGNLAKQQPLERIEIEANEFSAALVVPMPELRVALKALSRDCDLRHVRRLARQFGVSLEMMSQIYVDNVDDKAAVVISHNGLVARVITPSGFPFLGLKKGQSLPREAFARTFRPTEGQNTSNLIEVLTHNWLEERGAVTAIYEQVTRQRDGWATTLLVVDEQEPDEDGDDRNWNRRNLSR
jgi:Zn-dependent peptidase ImmA (M78 family)